MKPKSTRPSSGLVQSSGNAWKLREKGFQGRLNAPMLRTWRQVKLVFAREGKQRTEPRNGFYREARASHEIKKSDCALLKLYPAVWCTHCYRDLFDKRDFCAHHDGPGSEPKRTGEGDGGAGGRCAVLSEVPSRSSRAQARCCRGSCARIDVRAVVQGCDGRRREQVTCGFEMTSSAVQLPILLYKYVFSKI